MVTLGGLVSRAAAELAAAPIEAPRREAVRLVADLAGRPRGEVVLRAEEAAPEELVVRTAAATRRRAAGEPLAYVVGWTEFRRLALKVDRRVLIPRPETEGLVDLVLEGVRGGTAIDVGTGSGCIALSLAVEGDYQTVLGIDRSADALSVARTNARGTGAAVRFLQGDLLAGLREAPWCDLVVSNPPYLSAGEYAGLDPSVREWEPRAALESGGDGMEAIARLLRDAGRVMRPGGLLALEVDSSRAAESAVLAQRSGWGNVAIFKDLFGRDRYLTARRETTP